MTASRLASDVFGDMADVFTAALAVGRAGNALARRRRRSLLIFIVPGILILVPGATGFENSAELFDERPVYDVRFVPSERITSLGEFVRRVRIGAT